MILKPFPFQQKLKDYFKKQGKTWDWFADKKIILTEAVAASEDAVVVDVELVLNLETTTDEPPVWHSVTVS